MKPLFFAFPGDLSTPTGGYIYDRRIIAGLEHLGWDVQCVGLGDGFPSPDQTTVAQARQTLLSLTSGVPVVMDGLALGVLPEAVAALARRNPVIGLIHHPLAFESGLSPERVALLTASETEALSHVSQVIVTSPATARDLVRCFGVQTESIEAILPGTEPAPASNPTLAPDALASGKDRVSGHPMQPHTLRLLSVGSIVPRKGFDVLLAALEPLGKLSWTLSIAGDATRDLVAPAQLARDIARFGFTGRVHVLGAVDEAQLESLYQEADVFVLASHFEGYGMAFAEALARGLPVIGTTGGAIPETVPEGAGLLVPPGDVERLTQALQRMMQDETLRARLSAGAREAAARQPTWQDSSRRFSEVVLRFAD